MSPGKRETGLRVLLNRESRMPKGVFVMANRTVLAPEWTVLKLPFVWIIVAGLARSRRAVKTRTGRILTPPVQTIGVAPAS